MKTDKKLTLLGLALLASTILINQYHQSEHPGQGFNYAYVTGIAMVIIFLTSFVKFNFEKLRKPKN